MSHYPYSWYIMMHSLLLLLLTLLPEAEAVCGTDWKNADDPNSLPTQL